MSETTKQYVVSGRPQSDPSANSLLPFTDPNYAPPTPDDISAVKSKLGLTGSQIADLVGVDSRTVRKWISSPDLSNHREMPYAAWRLLLIAGRLVPAPDVLSNNEVPGYSVPAAD